MSPLSLVFASVRFYWRTHLGVLLGTALAAMVLIGSLLVGDSVNATLRRQALERVGRVEALMTAGDRFFQDRLAGEIAPDVAPLLLLRASAARTDGTARVNQAQLLGVDDRFWALALQSVPALTGEDVALNRRAATQLGVKEGDTIVLRVEKPGLFSRDAPLSGEENEVIAIRTTVQRIVEDGQFGRFGLTASQVPPFNLYLPLSYLQKRLDFAGKANALLSPKSIDQLEAAVRERWTLADAGLEFREIPQGRGRELRSTRVFLEPEIVSAAPKGLDGLTYLVNELRAGDKATPYSMVAAVDAPSSGFLPAELNDDEIVITQWLADDLGVKANDRLTLKYFVMGERRQLVEMTRQFEIIQILPMNEPVLDSSWMPDFPGLSDQANCRDWKPGFAIDNKKIRDQDEAYWKQYRGTPKAFVNLHVGQQMWGNRWGSLTTIRYGSDRPSAELASQMRSKLSVERLGFAFSAMRSDALSATKAPVDFGQLFVSFSFFLIVAAAVLTGLLFVFTLEQRAAEAGTLLALGLTPRLVRRMQLAEGTLLAIIGSALGTVAALVYTQLVLRGLSTVWRGAVGTSEFAFDANPASLTIGAISSVLVAVLAMWWASRRQLRSSARELLAGTASGDESKAVARGRFPYFSVIALLGAGAIALFAGSSPEAFFGAGSLLLIGGIGLGRRYLLGAREAGGFAAIVDLARRNTSRRLGRSVATISVLASGVFMVVAVDSFRKDSGDEVVRRDSGTGGFALVATSASAIYEDLNTASGRETYGLDEAAMKDVQVVPLRVREGDDASCLNLNRALQPRLLAVRPQELASRGAFKFGQADAAWTMLDEVRADGAVPGIIDGNTLQWALQMSIGDTLEYRDERGQPFRVRIVAALAGSMLQGSVVIGEKHFIEKYPGSGGYRFFLVDTPAAQSAAVAEELSRSLQDRGLEITPSRRRLAEFEAVENTYLSIFQALGGLGLLLGTAGLAIVVARNVLERRREFGLLEAVGFRPEQLRSLIFAEHRWLIVLGLVIGTSSALLGVWPQLASRSDGFPWQGVLTLLVALTVGCVFWTWLATRAVLRGSQLPALRNE